MQYYNKRMYMCAYKNDSEARSQPRMQNASVI